MRYGTLGQGGDAVAVAEPRSGSMTSGTAVKEIPYDYVATFKLTGVRGARTQDVINISTEGTFVAVSVGSSFTPAARALTAATAPPPFDTMFGALFTGAGPGFEAKDAFTTLAESLLLRFGGIHFLYSIVDSGSGRELQNKAVHNIAGLGAADGDRPFRPFARPVPFVPRSTIRIEIEELSAGPLFKDGTLFLVLHGYKRLGE
ncbi:MAG: hypothetical protein IT178_09895 [Acidobacteria bacterium]|nr:hypothetical protein [Acidobacteriota bacterium]